MIALTTPTERDLLALSRIIKHKTAAIEREARERPAREAATRTAQRRTDAWRISAMGVPRLGGALVEFEFAPTANPQGGEGMVYSFGDTSVSIEPDPQVTGLALIRIEAFTASSFAMARTAVQRGAVKLFPVDERQIVARPTPVTKSAQGAQPRPFSPEWQAENRRRINQQPAPTGTIKPRRKMSRDTDPLLASSEALRRALSRMS